MPSILVFDLSNRFVMAGLDRAMTVLMSQSARRLV
jgi:hypothetical protein